jgi:hypothetical protein
VLVGLCVNGIGQLLESIFTVLTGTLSKGVG